MHGLSIQRQSQVLEIWLASFVLPIILANVPPSPQHWNSGSMLRIRRNSLRELKIIEAMPMVQSLAFALKWSNQIVFLRIKIC